MSALSDETIDKIATFLDDGGCDGGVNCRFKPNEAETVHTLAKYIKSEDIPALGNFVKLLNKAEQEIGMWVIRVIFWIGGGGAVVAILIKLGIIKWGGGK